MIFFSLSTTSRLRSLCFPVLRQKEKYSEAAGLLKRLSVHGVRLQFFFFVPRELVRRSNHPKDRDGRRRLLRPTTAITRPRQVAKNRRRREFTTNDFYIALWQSLCHRCLFLSTYPPTYNTNACSLWRSRVFIRPFSVVPDPVTAPKTFNPSKIVSVVPAAATAENTVK